MLEVSLCSVDPGPVKLSAKIQPQTEEICVFSHKTVFATSEHRFYHAAVTTPLVFDLIVVEVSSPTTKMVPVKVSKNRCMISQEPFLQRG